MRESPQRRSCGQGGSGIGLWNVSNNFNAFGHGEWGQMPEQMDRMRDWVVEATDRERVAAGRRVYHYLPLYKVDHAVSYSTPS